MRLLGIDIGVTSGLCVMDIDLKEKKEYPIKELATVELRPVVKDEYINYRAAKVVEEFIELSEADFIVIEGYAYGGSGFFNVNQAEIQGQIKRFIIDKNIPLLSAHQQNMKKATVEKGNAKKKDVKLFVKEQFKDFNGAFKTKRPHIYDATLCAYFGYLYIMKAFNKKQNKIVEETIINIDRLREILVEERR
jgi:Holliday junction resolvasome RuvABC endonuclease subunit